MLNKADYEKEKSKNREQVSQTLPTGKHYLLVKEENS